MSNFQSNFAFYSAAPVNMRNSLMTDRTKKKRKAVEKHAYAVRAAIKKPLIAKRQLEKEEEKKEEENNEE